MNIQYEYTYILRGIYSMGNINSVRRYVVDKNIRIHASLHYLLISLNLSLFHFLCAKPISSYTIHVSRNI